MNISPINSSGNSCASCSSAASNIVRLKVVAFDLGERLSSQARANAKLKLQLKNQAHALAPIQTSLVLQAPPINDEAIKAISADYERRISSLILKKMDLEKQLKDTRYNADKMLSSVQQKASDDVFKAQNSLAKLKNFLNGLPQDLQTKIHSEKQAQQARQQQAQQAQVLALAQPAEQRDQALAQRQQQLAQKQQKQAQALAGAQAQAQQQAQAQAQKQAHALVRAQAQAVQQAQQAQAQIKRHQHEQELKAKAARESQAREEARAAYAIERKAGNDAGAVVAAMMTKNRERQDFQMRVPAAAKTLADDLRRTNNNNKRNHAGSNSVVEVVDDSDDTDSDKTESDYGDGDGDHGAENDEGDVDVVGEEDENVYKKSRTG